MHAEAKQYITDTAHAVAGKGKMFAVDLGGRETNGHARDVWGPGVKWIVVDAVAGPGVDIVANARDWQPDKQVELVMCAEVFEHTPYAPDIIANAYRMLKKGGYFVTTMAGPGRDIHGVNHDDPDMPGYYQNVTYDQLGEWLMFAGFQVFEIEENHESHDLYAWARK